MRNQQLQEWRQRQQERNENKCGEKINWGKKSSRNPEDAECVVINFLNRNFCRDTASGLPRPTQSTDPDSDFPPSPSSQHSPIPAQPPSKNPHTPSLLHQFAPEMRMRNPNQLPRALPGRLAA